MRILYLSHFFPPTHTSGAENYTYGIARAMVEREHQVHVLCAGTWDSGKEYWNGYTDEIYEGINVRRLRLCWYKAPDPNKYLYDNPVVAQHLREWLDVIQPDIVHITSCYTLSASVIQPCKDAGIPVIVTLVDFWFICLKPHLMRSDGTLCDGQTTPWECLRCVTHRAKIYRWPARLLPDWILKPILTAISKCPAISRLRGLRGIMLNIADRKDLAARHLQESDVVIAPSRFLASTYAAVIDGLPIRLQSYGHDLTWLVETEPKSRRKGFRFCYMGQVAYHKGAHVLLDAFLRLKSLPNIALDVWGSLDSRSSYVRSLERLAAGSNDIYLRGRFTRPQLADVLSQADVVVVPSLWYENNPLVIQEAFAAGVPVIATDLGGMSEFVQHEVNGLLFERANIDDLARQMRRVVEEPSLLEELRAGIPPVKTIEQEVTELFLLYEELQGPTPRHRD